jgi:hypothetical protein
MNEFFPEIVQKVVKMMRDIDATHWKKIVGAKEVNVRTCEYHEYFGPSQGLGYSKHTDAGSLLTCDMMLSESDSFEGGEFQTLEPDGTMMPHVFKRGDMVVFDSDKFHSVSPIRSGRRNVLIFELWEGPPRYCAHRCCHKDPACEFDLTYLHDTLRGEKVVFPSMM